MKAGKSTNQALLRTLASKEALNFATRRMIRDLREFEDNKLPTVGVSARPMDDDFFIWHANIRGPEGTPYEGGVFHIELNIPQTYPHNPPEVTIMGVDLPHPNVFGRKICLDMLEADKREGQGWSTAYSIMSILIQLQSFLFEKFYDDKDHEKEIKKAIEQANSFKCCRKNCKHGGKLAAWPPFDAKETDLEAFKILESEVEIFKNELICYHTKMTAEENPLGIGLSVTRVARTGLIKQANPCLDYISLKAFIKEGIREASNNEKFTHWLPLLFGLDEKQKARTFHLVKKAISMICTGNTKHFKEKMILDLFPKIFITLSVLIMNEKRHASIRILKLFCHVHYMYLALLEEFPELVKDIDSSIQEFVKLEEKRHKDVIPSLGAFQAHFIICWDKLKEALPAVQDEQFDRQVFWLLKAIPELEKGADDFLDDKRAQITFSSQQTSYQNLVFWVMISRYFQSNFKSRKELLDHYSKNLGRLGDKMETDIQKRCFDILKISSYDQMWEYIGMGKLTPEELNKKLKKSMENSKRRKYHGTDDEILTLPSKEEQIKTLEQHYPKLTDFLVGEKEKKKLKELPEAEWKKNATARWLWIRDIVEHNEDIDPSIIAQISDDLYYRQYDKRKEDHIRLRDNYLQNMSDQSEKAYLETKRYGKSFSWRDLFVKLDLETSLLQMDNNPDFTSFYDKIKAGCEFVTSIVIPIISVKNIKSGHYYLTALLTQLTKLKHLQIVGTSSSTELNLACLKSLAKGFHNFLEHGGALDEIKFGKFTIPTNSKANDIHDKLFNTILSLTSLNTLTVENNNMFYAPFKGSKALAKIVLSHKNLVNINLRNTQLQEAQAKDIADGLMRAKQLETLCLSENLSIGNTGLTSIIYNLAFSPRLVKLDISRIPLTSSLHDLTESLYKLLRISASLQELDMSYCGSLNGQLPEQFFIALGEVRTLKKLNLSNSGVFNDTGAQNLGKAIAFNARKEGVLEYVNLDGSIANYNQLKKVYDNMEVSDADHEKWYGDASKVEKMSGKDFAKVFYNNLKSLQFNGCNLHTQFDYTSWKKQYNPEDPHFVKLLARSPQLTNVQLSRASLGPKDCDILALALDPTRANFASKIKILNLSRNNLGKEGAKVLATIFEKNNILEVLDVSHTYLGVAGAKSLAAALEKNKSLKFLNLFCNKIDVDGARSFEKTLSQNSSLEFIEFGHNRLRDEGLSAIARGIAANKNSKIKTLGLRFNFIDGEGVISFLKKLYPEGGKKTLESIFVKNNSINEFGLYDILRVVQKMKIKLNIDLFDKLKLLDNELLDRTVWIHPAPGTCEDIKRFLEVEHKCGVVLSVRKRTGPKWPNRQVQSNTFYFVEFAAATSVTRALHIASRRQANILGMNVRILKAGTGTYYYTKQKKRSVRTVTRNVGGRPRGRSGPPRGRGRGGAPRGRGRR